MERSIELEWREIIAHLDDSPAPPDDNGFAHWSIAAGAMALLPMATPETWPAAFPIAVVAILLGLIGIRRATRIGRGRTRATVGVMLGTVPLLAALAIGIFTLVVLTG